MSEAIERAAAVLGDRAKRDVPLGPLTTYGVGGSAALFLERCGPDDLMLAREAVAASGVPVLIVGRGSNLLVSDRGFPGLALTLGDDFTAIHRDGDSTLVRAGGGLSLPVLARRTAALGLRGLEWAVGVPGTVGGGVRMNAGAYGRDWSDVLVRALVVTGEGEGWLTPEELGLGYRRSVLAPHDVVAMVEYRLESRPPAEIRAAVAELVAQRKATQPTNRRTFGSVFKNPPGSIGAGRMLELCGLKGHRIGGAVISPKHANFIENADGATSADCVALMLEARRRAREEFGVELQREVVLAGLPELAPLT